MVGYNLGLTGAKPNNTYEKEVLKSAYDTGYPTGYNEYNTKWTYKFYINISKFYIE